MNGLSLFSGIGGIEIGLSDWVKPVLYCEKDRFCQSVLLSRMSTNDIPTAPICDDILQLQGQGLKGNIDIIYGGFPCQDISVAGHGAGLEGKRSGLFFEIMRLAKEIKPKFIFLENVPAITTRGGLQVVREIAEMGYDCRWCHVSAAEVGARHKRERWFLLGYSKHYGSSPGEGRGSIGEVFAQGKPNEERESQEEQIGESPGANCLSLDVANSYGERLEKRRWKMRSKQKFSLLTYISKDTCYTYGITSKQAYKKAKSKYIKRKTWRNDSRFYRPYKSRNHWQQVVDSICRSSDGVSNHVDKLRSLGNSCVPQQARKAFKILMGIK